MEYLLILPNIDIIQNRKRQIIFVGEHKHLSIHNYVRRKPPKHRIGHHAVDDKVAIGL
jgi:hypothetical protein